MATELLEPIEIFFSYAPEDKKLQERLDKHLTILKRRGFIKTWDAYDVSAGSELSRAVAISLDRAGIILLLVSADFIASDYCYGIHMERVLLKHNTGLARVIPIILRPVDWKEAPFGKLQALPKNGKPVTTWRERDMAFVEISQNIEKVCLELRSPVDLKWTVRFSSVSRTQYYEEALKLFKRELDAHPSDGSCWYYVADILKVLRHFPEALKAYDQALNLGMGTMGVIAGRAKVLYALKKYQEALREYEYLVYSLAPRDPYCRYSYSIVLYQLKRFYEVWNIFQSAKWLSPDIFARYQDDQNALNEPNGFRKLVMQDSVPRYSSLSPRRIIDFFIERSQKR